MTFTYVIGTGNRDTLRLLITDTDNVSHMFEDEELDMFLVLEGDNVRLSAALALETIATNEVMVQKRIRMLDLTTDGPAESKALLERAALLRAQGAETTENDNAPAFAVADMVTNPFGYREKLYGPGL